MQEPPKPLRTVSAPTISTATAQQVAKEQMAALVDTTGIVMGLEEYQALTSINGREEMQIVLAARDVFSDEIRVLITNGNLLRVSCRVIVDSGNRRTADIRLYSGAENLEIGRQVLDGEFVMGTSFCNSFYLLYTTRGALHVHNSRTT